MQIRLFDNKTECCGCGLCAAVCAKNAITMLSDGRFTYPEIDREKCVSCGVCVNTCRFKQDKDDTTTAVKAYAAKADKQIRLSSSSGGIFTAVSDVFLSKGGIVIGADFDMDMHVVHTVAETAEARDRMRGAKYVQSDISGVFKPVKEALSSGRPVFFTGTPCQVAALKKYVGPDAGNLFTADLICHGVPSPEIFAAFIGLLEKKYGKKVAYFKFRNKAVSWRRYSPVVTFADGSEEGENDLTGSFTEVFRYELCLRPSCTVCGYTSMHREGDITIGDFWGIENRMPELDDGAGVSAVMLNTEKAIGFFAENDLPIELFECAPDDIAAGQVNMKRPSVLSPLSEDFYGRVTAEGIEKALKKYTRTGISRRMKDTVKALIGKK